MKVCYFTHLPNLTGANRSLLDMIDGFDRRVIEPFVIINGHGPIENELKKRNIKYTIAFYSPATNSDNVKKNILKGILNTKLINRISVEMIKKILIKENVELLHNNTYIVGAGMQAAYELGIPYICHIRELVWEDHHRKFFFPDRQECLLKNANGVIAITESVKEKFKSMTTNEITVLYDGIKLSNYLLPLENKFTQQETIILLAGRITPGKGQLEAIKAIEVLNAKNVYNIKLVIIGGVGDEQYNALIQKYVSDNHLKNVEFIEFINELKDIRRKCDIGLTCSKAEALGRVTIENMLSSLLVIGGNSAGTKELLKDGVTGLLYNCESYEDLADKIETAITNKVLSNRIIKNAYIETQDKFDNMKYSNKVFEYYIQTMGKI